jgi:hypothetical protein
MEVANTLECKLLSDISIAICVDHVFPFIHVNYNFGKRPKNYHLAISSNCLQIKNATPNLKLLFLIPPLISFRF